jgi:hypothetical protein
MEQAGFKCQNGMEVSRQWGEKEREKKLPTFPDARMGGASFRIDCIVRRGNSKQTGRGKPVYLNTEVVSGVLLPCFPSCSLSRKNILGALMGEAFGKLTADQRQGQKMQIVRRQDWLCDERKSTPPMLEGLV